MGNYITVNECELLINKCNNYLDTPSISELIKDGYYYNQSYTDFLSSIAIKLIMLTGISLDTLNSLTINDYNRVSNEISINGYLLTLPNLYGKQLDKYLCVREHILADKNTKKFFIKRNEQDEPLETNTICSVFKEIRKKDYGVRNISEFVIIELMKKKIPDYLLMQLTGYKSTIINHCSKVAMSEMECSEEEYLNSILRKSNLFDEL